MKRTLFVFLGAIALTAGFTFTTLEDYLWWSPSNMEAYDFDVAQRATKKPVSRVISEEVTKIVMSQNLNTVSGSVLMDEVLSSYRDIRREHGDGVALIGAIKIMELWDPERMSVLRSSFEELTGEFTVKANSLFVVKARVEKARGARDFVRSIPDLPDGNSLWYSVFGAEDSDVGGGSMPFSGPDITMPDVPGPLDLGSRKDRIDLRMVDLATRIATHGQKKNSVFWQGSKGFSKGANDVGINPSDVWQTIYFNESWGKVPVDIYIEKSAGLAAVMRDASIAAWKVKYRDWTMRPSMRIAKLEASIGNPSFPGYVSGHAVNGAAAAHYLKRSDPESSGVYTRLARDSEKSRLFGGVHTPSDNIVGFRLGEIIAAQHLKIEAPSFEELYPNEGRIELAMDILEAVLDLSSFIEGGVSRIISLGEVRFEISEDSPPAPRSKPGRMDSNDTSKGAIASADLNDDGLPDLLMSGHKSVRVYQNKGGLEFEVVQEIETASLNGSYFTKDEKGEVDGLWVFGESAPRWHERVEGMSFESVGVVPDGMPTDEVFNFKGMVLRDLDGDGDEDALFLNYDTLSARDGTVFYGETGLWDHRVSRHESGFVYVGREGDGPSRTFAGGFIDFDGDGSEEYVRVEDGFSLTIQGADIEMGPRVSGSIAGMSFTPIHVNGREALHISSIFDGDSELYQETVNSKDGGRQIDGDILVALSDGMLRDVSKETLQTGPLQWSWGSQAGDLNGDGREDLVVVYGFTSNVPFDCGIRILLQREDGIFEPSGLYLDIGEFYPRSVLLQDMDGDKDLDILMSSGRRSQLWENTSGVVPAVDFSSSRQDITGFLTQRVPVQHN